MPVEPASRRLPPASSPARGLSAAEAAARLASSGPNEIRRGRRTPRWILFAAQFKSALIGLLFVASIASVLLGEVADAIAIGAIVLLNAIVGFLQESRAEQALHALRAMTAPRARVLRDGHAVVVPALEIVPGDVLLLEAGDVVAADARLVEADELTANEASLTGESVPSRKAIAASASDAPLAERSDFVFLGTAIATGSGAAEVTATGMNTELGKIAHLLADAAEGATPLQERLAGVARTLLLLCLGIVALVAGLGLWRGATWLEVLMTSVSLAVAAVPEGLPAVVTIALALGVQRLAARHVLVRRLSAVETLGSVTVVCTDKTGTLTTGVMTVRELWGPDEEALLLAAASCCDAELEESGEKGNGDPTEIALLVAAAKRGIQRSAIESERPRTKVHPFDSTRKRMSVQRIDGVLYVKGALESVLPNCRESLEGVLEAHASMAQRGLRVLAIATGEGSEETELKLLGLIGMADPPRPDAIAAVREAHAAGIRTVMITGDHPVTALAIGRDLGILREGDDVADTIHARVTAEEKLLIVRRWKERGEIVAMTGDGVNDAPSLQEAHIGIAMGRTGTEVTREASDMVLTDDNFASIIAAVNEGRGIYENIRKTLVYLLGGNVGELMVMFAAALLGFPMPLLPLHLLWINLVTESFPALALVTDPPSPDLLERPPRSPSEPILGAAQWRSIVLMGALGAAVTLGVFVWALDRNGLASARSLAFTTLVFAGLFRAFAARSATRVLFEVGVFTNLKLIGVIVFSFLIQLAIFHFGPSRTLFDLVPLGLADWGLALGLGLLPVTILELRKLVRRALRPRMVGILRR